MIGVYPAGQSRSFNVEYVGDNNSLMSPSSASYILLDENDLELIPPTPLDMTSSPTSSVIEVVAANNTLTDTNRAFRRLIVDYSDSLSSYQVEIPYIIESIGVVSAGENSFASYGSLILESLNLSNMEAFNEASISDQRAALINAWHNISNISVSGIEGVSKTDQITSEMIGEINPRIMQRLKQAQLIEANFILGGDPIEDRRRSGMISDSSGESAQFFRTSKPLELPVCKDAVKKLGGLVKWNMKISR